MRRMLPFDCVHLYRRNIYWEPASSETDDVHFLSLYRLGSIVEVCCANRWQSAYLLSKHTACVLLWQAITRAPIYTAALAPVGQSSPLVEGLLYVTQLESSIDWWCNKLLSPTCPPDAYSERRQFTHVCITHLDAPTLQEHMPAADAPYYKRSQPDHCAVHSSHRRVAMRVPPFPSISRHAALSHRLASTCAPAPPSFRGFAGLLMHGTLGHKSFHH